MRADELMDAIGQVDDNLIQDAKQSRRKKRPSWIKWSSAVAACLCLVVIGIYFRGGVGGGAGGGGDFDLSYMRYNGPVLPLTLMDGGEGIQAQRNVDFDFLPYAPGDGETTWSKSQVMVTDHYTLSNVTDEPVEVTALYPFVGDLDDTEHHSKILVDGQAASATINAGPYAGGYIGVWGAINQEIEAGSANLRQPDSFEDYQQLLSDGSYQASAFDPFPVLDQPVVVYRMSDYVYSADTSATNPTLEMEFDLDYSKTQVFTYNFNGGTDDRENGCCARHRGAVELRPNASPRFRQPEDAWLILLGEDIKGYNLQGYRNGGCHEGEELDDLSCTITRYETTLEEILYHLISKYEQADLLYGLASELLVTDGLLGQVKQRYDNGMLEDIISAAQTNDRVFYLSFDLVIPSGGQVEVTALTCKDASMDFIGDDAGEDGYDMATRLGSNLTFTGQTASISNYDHIEITGQNFGFDPDHAIDQVELDAAQEHYWLEVRTRKRR